MLRWVMVAALALAGCGDDGDGDGSGTGGAGGSGAGSGGSGAASNGGSGGGAGWASGGGAGAGSGGASGAGNGGSSGAGGSGGSSGAAGPGLSAKYPGDVGIENDPAVVWVENFEQGSVSAVLARYEDSKNAAGMQLVPDVPANSSGSASLELTAGGGADATDFYKRLDPGYEQWFVRYYAKYQSGVEWHHTGVWIGGYNPASNWPSPQAGLKPDGDDRFSISFEPIEDGANPRMDFYNYWMKMHSWMDNPSGGTAYYGNTLIHQSSLVADGDQWMCIEIQVKLNPNPSSGAGAELALWKNDQLVVHFTDQSPTGYWIKDKFCPQNADGSECTNYPPASGTQMIPLDLQLRSTSDLKLNAFWPQNYITSGGAGSVYYDDMVIATERIGCLK